MTLQAVPYFMGIRSLPSELDREQKKKSAYFLYVQLSQESDGLKNQVSEDAHNNTASSTCSCFSCYALKPGAHIAAALQRVAGFLAVSASSTGTEIEKWPSGNLPPN